MCENLRKVFTVQNKELLQWFPGHMELGMRQVQQRLKMVDCVIEVHDSRIPFSGRNVAFKQTITTVKPHVLVLNKKDLSDEYTFKKTAQRIVNQEGIDHVVFTNCKDHQCKGVKQILPIVTDLIGNSNRYNRTEETAFNLMIIGVPNVGKSSLTNVLRNRHLKRGAASAVGAIAGITRTVLNRIKISEKPLIYLFDTPGILTPKVNDVEQGMKLATVSCLQDHLVGSPVIADYILYWMNKNGYYSYTNLYNLEEPTDNIEEVLLAGAKILNKYMKIKHHEGYLLKPNFDAVATHMIRAFRSGELGKFNLDHHLCK